MRIKKIESKKNKIQFSVFFLLVAYFALTFYSCSIFSPVGNFIGTQYQNLVGYFNTYYNAKKVYSTAMESVHPLQGQSATSVQGSGSSKYPALDLIDVMVETEVTSDVKSKFDLVIEKCSKILNNYQKSTLIDDALLMMGKSYYYSSEYTRAERKFLELIKQFPESDLIDEAKIWCGKTFFKNRRDKDAFLMLDDLLVSARNKQNREVITSVNLIYANYSLIKYDSVKATNYYSEALKAADNDEMIAQICFRLGEIFEKFDSIKLAADYYYKASDYSTNNNLKYWSLNKYGSFLAKMGNLDDALNLFLVLKENKFYQEFLANTYLEIAGIYYDKKDIENAISNYLYLDTNFTKTESSAKGYYKLGLIYELDFKNYSSARECFKKCKEQAVNIQETFLADKRFVDINNYYDFQRSINDLDSILRRSYIPDTLFKTKYDTIWVTVFDTILPAEEVKNKPDSNTSIKKSNIGDIKDSLGRRDSNTIKDNLSDKKNLSEPILDEIKNIRDSAFITRKSINTSRKESNISEKNNSLESLSSENLKADSIIIQKKRKIDTITSEKISEVQPLDTAAIQRNIINLAKKKFEFGTFWRDNFYNIDSAIYWFKESYDGLPKDSVFDIYLFEIAKAYELKGDKTYSDSLFRLIIEKYPQSGYVLESKIYLGIPIETIIDTAQIYYAQADSLLELKKNREAIKLFEKIIKNFPSSDLAAKSQFAIGWVYENIEKDNKKAIEEYRKLLEFYPKTQYAQIVSPKIDTVDSYDPVKKKARAKADSAALKKSKITDEPLVQEKIPEKNVTNILNKEKSKVDSSAIIKPDVTPNVRRRPIRTIQTDTTSIK